MLTDPNISGGGKDGNGGYTEGARAYNAANLITVTSTWLVIALNSEQYDTDDIHHLTVNNSRLTCKTEGVYTMWGGINWATHTGGIRYIRIMLNGATYLSLVSQTPSAFVSTNIHMIINVIAKLAINDYIELGAYQTTGGDLLIGYVATRSPVLAMQRIG